MASKMVSTKIMSSRAKSIEPAISAFGGKGLAIFESACISFEIEGLALILNQFPLKSSK